MNAKLLIGRKREAHSTAKPWKKVQTLPAFFHKTEKSCTTNSNSIRNEPVKTIIDSC